MSLLFIHKDKLLKPTVYFKKELNKHKYITRLNDISQKV